MARDKIKNVARAFRNVRSLEYHERRNSNRRVLICLGLYAVVVATLLMSEAHCQTKKSELALLLARTCVAEIGFKGDISECQLMWSINQRNAAKKRRSLRRQTLLFNSFWKCKSHRKKKPWLKHLNGYKAPRYWPKTMSWPMFRDRWIEIEIAAIEFVNTRKIAPICQDAVDYGAPGETPAMGNVEKVHCGETRQRYWRVKHGKTSRS